LVPYTGNPDFVGRGEILRKLKAQLSPAHRSHASATSPSKACLYGLGGIGKTQIAIAYVFWAKQTYPGISVFWVHASNPERFCQSYALIAEECQIPGFQEPGSDVLALVKTWLERTKGKWLMVIDSADDMEMFFGRGSQSGSSSTAAPGSGTRDEQHALYIPECRNGVVLVATRNMQVGSRLTAGKHLFEVKKMDGNETEQLIRAGLDGLYFTAVDSETLSSRLEHLPLAIVQACSYIRENAISITAYLQLLDDGSQTQIEMLTKEFETFGRDSSAPRSVAETWMLSFQQVKRQNPLGGQLLALMSSLDRQAIPLEFLSSSWQDSITSELQKALGILKAFSFVSEDKPGKFSIHRLLQLITQKCLQSEGRFEQVVDAALGTVFSVYYSKVQGPERWAQEGPEDWAVQGSLIPHVMAVLKHVGSHSEDMALTRAALLLHAGRFVGRQSRWKCAGELLLEARQLCELHLGEMHPTTLLVLAALVEAHKSQGRSKEAEEVGKRLPALLTLETPGGEEDPCLLPFVAPLASTYASQGKLKEAEELLLRFLDYDNPDTEADELNSIDTLTEVLPHKGQLKKAEEWGTKGLK
ncbi:P-loop containing nucleoside triphosphate hydrolase protein, partial [Immersiella caudata]